MKAVVVLMVTVIGSQFCDLDFCTLHTMISIAMNIHEEYSSYTHDKTA